MSHTQTSHSTISKQHRCMPRDRFTVGQIKLIPTSAKPIQATLPHIPSEGSPHEDDAAAAAQASQWRLEEEVLWNFHDCVW